MPIRLRRLQQTGDSHFITFSCDHRQPSLSTDTAKDVFEQSLETVRERYRFLVYGYVVMPEHVQLLVSEPEESVLSVALQALKVSAAKRMKISSPFWERR